MSPAEYRVVLHRLGLEPMTATRLPGITSITSDAWANGDEPVPAEVARLLPFLMRAKIGPPELDRLLEFVSLG